MRIVDIDMTPFHSMTYELVNEHSRVEHTELPFLRARVDHLATELSAIIVVSDLQGRFRSAAKPEVTQLLGEALAEELAVASELGLIPPLSNVGILLAGDLFARPELDRRGGTGDVRDVWRAFAKNCRWVAGVAGNHDCFGEKPSLPEFKGFCREPRIHFLDGEVVELDGLRIGGLSGIIGPPRKPFRRTEESYVDELARLAAKAPDIVVLHDGPGIPIANLRGSPSIRIALEQTHPFLVIRGHAHWDNPLIRLANGGQVLNVDARLVMLVR